MSAIEQTLCVIRECHVYRIPPRAESRGYHASDWEGHHIWTGRCRVISIGEKCEIRLEDPSNNSLFACCVVNRQGQGPRSVEPVIDSSRYFVLRIEDAGRHAFIGMGFQERSDAFDFNVALRDHEKNARLEEQSEKNGEDFLTNYVPKRDYSLKEGQQITVNLGERSSAAPPAVSSSFAAPAAAGNPFFIPPPPSGGSRKVQAGNNNAGGGFGFSDFKSA